jgi:hypothetical protein
MILFSSGEVVQHAWGIYVRGGVIYFTTVIKGKVILSLPTSLIVILWPIHFPYFQLIKETFQQICILCLELLRGTIKSNIKISFGMFLDFPLHIINISIPALGSFNKAPFLLGCLLLLVCVLRADALIYSSLYSQTPPGIETGYTVNVGWINSFSFFMYMTNSLS